LFIATGRKGQNTDGIEHATAQAIYLKKQKQALGVE
jgi:hypothetical protein